MNRKNGFASIPLMIGLLLMAVAIPAVTSLVQNRQDTRNKATYECSETTRPKTSCPTAGQSWTCNSAKGVWECHGAATTCSGVTNATECAYIPGCNWNGTSCTGNMPTTTPYQTMTPVASPTSSNSMNCCCNSNGTDCGWNGMTCSFIGKVNTNSSYCTAPTPTKVPTGCAAITNATECAYIPGCNWSNNKCSGTYPTTTPYQTMTPTKVPTGCAAITNATECAYIPGCNWSNGKCSGTYPTTTPYQTMTPTKSLSGTPTVNPSRCQNNTLGRFCSNGTIYKCSEYDNLPQYFAPCVSGLCANASECAPMPTPTGGAECNQLTSEGMCAGKKVGSVCNRGGSTNGVCSTMFGTNGCGCLPQTSCSQVMNATECGYIPGCKWTNGVCTGTMPTTTPYQTMTPTSNPLACSVNTQQRCNYGINEICECKTGKCSWVTGGWACSQPSPTDRPMPTAAINCSPMGYSCINGDSYYCSPDSPLSGSQTSRVRSEDCHGCGCSAGFCTACVPQTGCGAITNATECAYVPGCNWSNGKCSGTFPTTTPYQTMTPTPKPACPGTCFTFCGPGSSSMNGYNCSFPFGSCCVPNNSCATVTNATECGYIPGCNWSNGKCSGTLPTTTPYQTMTPTPQPLQCYCSTNLSSGKECGWYTANTYPVGWEKGTGCGASPTPIPTGCAAITNPTECGYIPGCNWSNNKCTGTYPTTTPYQTMTPTPVRNCCCNVNIYNQQVSGCDWYTSSCGSVGKNLSNNSFCSSIPTSTPVPTTVITCSSISNPTACGYTPGCYWINGKCTNNVPTATKTPSATPTHRPDSCGAGATCKSYVGGTACVNAGGDIGTCTTATGGSGNCCVPNAGTPTVSKAPTPTIGICHHDNECSGPCAYCGAGGQCISGCTTPTFGPKLTPTVGPGSPTPTSGSCVHQGGSCANNNSCCGGLHCNAAKVCVGTVATATPTTGQSACMQCPSDFKCYTNGTEYKWFVTGYVMGGFTPAVTDTSMPPRCGGVIAPTFKGRNNGDANCDGKVNALDLSLWQVEFMTGTPPGTLVRNNWFADFTGPQGVCDGKVNAIDLALWQTKFNALMGTN